jgi:hypothetical protein
MENDLINDLLLKVKSNKKYKSISDKIILNEIKSYLSKNRIEKISKQDIKEIRSLLHKSYASFQTKKKNKMSKYLDELREVIQSREDSLINITNKLLSITLSTKERLNNYSFTYKEIFKITGKPKIILDLGSGFNLFSFPLMNLSMIEYYSFDINESDIVSLNNYYEIMKGKGLYGNATILDLRDLKQISKLPSSDIIFLFKVIDILDKDNHKTSEELIKKLISKTKFIVASFATKTITRKFMNFPNRKWFEMMLERNKFKFKIINTDNEIFYVISR